jgi:hypothetical protein
MMARDDDYPKVWRCPRCKGALGEVIRDGSGVRKLIVGGSASSPTVGASDSGGFSPQRPSPTKDVTVTITGDARVRCGCGAERAWVPGEEHLAQILERLQRWHSNQ